MSDKEIVATMPQDELMKMVLDGGPIEYQRTTQTGHETIRINVEEADDLFKQREILDRIKRIANTEQVEQ
jgi:hypothetical protein